ncbi:MAG: AMP-binding protein [Acidobacteriota bacterium]|nr:AMP-binding protein [Acidobacteriota bacterium]
MWTDFIRKHAQKEPDRTALIIADENCRKLSYADLDREASRWAAYFHSRGLTRGDRVALLATNRLEHLSMFFGCAKLGLIFVPLNFRLGPREIEEQLARLDTSLFFGSGPCELQGDHPYTDLEQFTLPEDTDYPEVEVSMDDCLLMLFTSGSTGIPKGVMLHAGMLLWNMINTALDWGMYADDVSMIQMPLFHTGGWNVTCLPLLRLGGALVMTDKFDAAQTLSLIREQRVTFYFAVPTMFRMMWECDDFKTSDLDSIRFCISGGAPCPISLIKAWQERGILLKQGFGLTEVGPNCFAMPDRSAVDRPDSVGRPAVHSHVKLIDEDGNTVPAGEVGELCLKGPHVTQGYWRMEETFAKVFHHGYFHTGDLMRADEDGFHYVVGRKKNMYISGGENVFPGEVVRQMVQHPGIMDALVVAVPDEKWGEVGYAFFQGDPDLDLDQLREFLNDRLSRYKHPHHLQRLDNFPLLANNKVDVQTLKKEALEATGG